VVTLVPLVRLRVVNEMVDAPTASHATACPSASAIDHASEIDPGGGPGGAAFPHPLLTRASTAE
jgi:hypothetical protein